MNMNNRWKYCLKWAFEWKKKKKKLLKLTSTANRYVVCVTERETETKNENVTTLHYLYWNFACLFFKSSIVINNPLIEIRHVPD